MRRHGWWMALAGLLWVGYWALGSWGLHQGVQQALAQARAQGLVVQVGALRTGGFPFAFDLALQPFDLGDPVAGLRWQTPRLRLQAATWRPWHLTASAAPDHEITLPGQMLALTGTAITANLTATPNTDLALSQISLGLSGPVLRSTLGWEVGADMLSAGLRLTDRDTHRYTFSFAATNLRPDPAFAVRAGLARVLPIVRLDGDLTMTAALDRHAGTTRPKLVALNLTAVQAVWGETTLQAEGRIVADATGLAEGRIDVTVKGWRSLVPMLVAAGTIAPGAAQTITGLLQAMANQGGNPETLEIPLIYAQGRASLGPLPLGPAPRLWTKDPQPALD